MIGDARTDTNAERAVIGACLVGWKNPDELDLEPSDFYRPEHEDIWAAILRVAAAGNRPDPASVRLALADRKPPIDPVQLFSLAEDAPAIVNAPAFAAKVRTDSGLRSLQQAGVALQEIGGTFVGDLDQAREEARQRVDEACRGRNVTKARRLADLLPDALDEAEHGTGGVIPTGWPDIDRSIGGLAPGRLVIFGARPGGGKSIAGTNLALQVAHKHGHAVLLASLEMPEKEVTYRLLAAHAGVSLTGLMNATVPDSDWAIIADKHAELDEMPIFVEDSSNLSVQGLRRAARDVQRQHEDLALIVVDYLQLMTPSNVRRNGSRAEEVSQIARDLKLLARETGACVVAMAQVNREGGKSTEGPRLTDLREGGAENDADVVVLLHRPDPEIPEVTVTIAKNRHGPLATATLQMQGHYARLASVAWSPTRGIA